MSRDRYDRDDDRDYYGGGSRERSSGYGSEDRYEQNRSDYGYGGAGSRGRDYGYDDLSGARPMTGSRAIGGGRDYGRGGGGGYDESRSGGGSYYGERSYGRGGEERDDYGRSMYEEGRGGGGYARGRSGSGRRSERGESRSRLRCRDIMTKDVTVATRDTTLQEVAVMMRDEDTGVIPVVERQQEATTTKEATADDGRRGNGRAGSHGRLVGLITDRDIVIRAIAEGKDALATRAEEVMTDSIHTAQPNDRVVDAIRKMGDKQVRRIPVVDGGGNLRGIISMADVSLETEEDRELGEALEEISSGSSFWSKIFG